MVSKGNHPQMALIQVSEILLFTHIYITYIDDISYLTTLRENATNMDDWLVVWNITFIFPYIYIPSGKHTKNYGKIHHFQLVNPLFLWAMFNSYVSLLEGVYIYILSIRYPLWLLVKLNIIHLLQRTTAR